MQKLNMVDADTLLYQPLDKPRFVVDGLLPTGLILFCGSQKIGKSWLMLKLCLCVSAGLPFWEMETREGDVLYLCLEDTFFRIQDRLFRLTDEADSRLHFAVASCKLTAGLIVQLEDYLKEYPDSRLIVIDTLQKVRTTSKDNAYASDYGDISLIQRTFRGVDCNQKSKGDLSMYHLRLKGDHYQMGVKRGNIFQKAHISFPLQLDNFQLEHGKQSEEILRKFFPEICEEVRGVSDAIGTDYLHFISWMLCMGCCMYNLENNIPVEVRGCTAFAYSSNGRTIYGRNNDLPPYLREGSKSEIYAPKNGNRFNITTSSFINGEEGVNEHGFAVAMTFVMTDLEKIKAGFNSCFIVRYLLEKADNTEQAVSLLMGLPVSSNCNILLADKKGNMVVVECTPILKKVRAAEIFENGSIVCTVNSFTSDEMKPYDDAKGNDYDSHRRYRTVLDSFSSERIKDEYIETTEHLLKGDYGFMCQYDDEPDFETVWSSIFDLDSLVIYRAEGDPRKKKFVTDNRLHDLIRRG